jgi:hypothetical protein
MRLENAPLLMAMRSVARGDTQGRFAYFGLREHHKAKLRIETNREATMPGKDLDRRAVLAMGAGASAAAVSSTRTQVQVAVPWSVGTEPPKTHSPPDGVDCHHHIYSSRFKVDPNSTLRPGDASVTDYRLLQKRIGTSRNVVVQPSTYGVFNDGLLEALDEFGPSARGVAVVNTDVTDAELKRLDGARL